MSTHDWDQVPFEDILADSKDGEWGIGDEAGSHTACWMIRGTDFAGINDPSSELPLRWIPDRLMERKRLQPGDVVFEMAGGTAKQSTGRSALVRSSFFETRSEHPVLCASFCRHLRLKPEYDSSFIYYLLQTLYRAGYMAVFNIQHTGVSRFQYTAFKKKTVLTIPKKPAQKKIAAILTAYDDLIENNQRRIAALEKMAEELYREWFVRLRFPGHEKVKLVKGCPVTWTEKKFGAFCVLQRGFDLPDAEVVPGPYPIIASTSIKGFHHEFRVKPPVVTTGRSGSLGEVLLVHTNAWPLNTALYVKDFCGNSAFLVYYTLKNMGLEKFNAGAGVPTLNRNHLTSIKINVPDTSLQHRFDEVIGPIHDQKEQFTKWNTALRQTRDLLLPRLISGKLRVDDLDIQFPPSMQAA